MIAGAATDILLGIAVLLIVVAAVTLVMFVGAWLWWNFRGKGVIAPVWERYYKPWSNRRHYRKMDKRAINQAVRQAREAKRQELRRRGDLLIVTRGYSAASPDPARHHGAGAAASNAARYQPNFQARR